MIITHANAHKWSKPVTENPSDHFGKNSVARINSTLRKIGSCNIQTKIEPISESFLQWFVPMYEQRINSKTNPRVFNIKEKTLNKKRTYYSLTLYENSKPLGATIFSINEDRFSIAYRTYENRWLEAKLQANPSLYTEYVACEYAHEKGCKTIIHGKDKNPYGVNSNIGLGAFKLSVGCQPKKSKVYEIQQTDTTKLHTDALIFELPGENEEDITKGYLVTKRDTEHKWVQATKYPHLVEIETVYRD